jgi:hypothetical protein
MMNSSEHTSAPFMTEVDLLRARVHELERGQAERQQPQETAVESAHLMALSRDVSVALISSSTLQKSLHLCTQALVDHLGAPLRLFGPSTLPSRCLSYRPALACTPTLTDLIAGFL